MTFLGNSYRALRALPWAVSGVSAALYTAAMPGYNLAEAAWFWAVPFLLWAASKPSWKTWLRAAFFAMWFAKIATLIWLRHVYPPLGWLGLVLLTALVAAFPAAWLALARWLFPKTDGAPLMARLILQLGLAGAWVVSEWIQSWLLTGFPWALLAETQWQRPATLAICQWGGPWAPGFAIMLFNIGIARYILRFVKERELAEEERLKALRPPAAGLGFSAPFQPAAMPGPSGLFRKLCPEFYLGALPLFFSAFTFLQSVRYESEHAETLFAAAVIQTDFDPNAKWDRNRAEENTAVVRNLTLAASRLTKERPVFEMRTAPGAAAGDAPAPAPKNADFAPAVIFWPEAALPFPVGTQTYDQFLNLQKLAADTGTTLLIGGITREESGGYYNGIFTVTGAEGLQREFYAKRHLVPFGEYVPLADILPLRKVVPIEHDSLVGTREDPLPVALPGDSGRQFKAGPLVCYEDVFPALAFDMARRGADFLVVLTNDAWYGREAGAYQHAAHSVVLAASLRLPVIRCGNNGWSGVINALGQTQPLTDSTGSIYFRGAGRFDVRGVPAPLRKPTFYVQKGDWLVIASGLLGLWAVLRNRRWRKEAKNEKAA
jgi:apolipoprotein N-acyltransferase